MADNDPTPAAALPADPNPADPASPAAAPRTFSQDDVDRIVQERLARAKTAPPADYDDLRAKAAKLDQLEAANKSELEKANERAARLEREKTAAEELVQRTRIESAIVGEAAKRGVDPDIAIAMVDRSAIDFDTEGKPMNIAQAMDSLLTAKPNLASGGARPNGADQGARGQSGIEQLTRDQLKQMAPHEIVKAQSEGRLTRILGAP